MEAISPELVLVDPQLAAVERPREFAVRVLAPRVVPLGVPLVPREPATGRPAWQVVALGVCLLASGLLLSLFIFRSPSSAAGSTPTVVPTAAELPIGPKGFLPPTPP